MNDNAHQTHEHDHEEIRRLLPSRVEPPTMPPAIAKAVIAVAKKVRQLGKDQTNDFAKFDYVSVDKFYEQVGPLMAEAGLFVVVDEDPDRTHVENKWIDGHYHLMLYHESGSCYGPIHRMLAVAATGPQAFGSAQSYVEKYFLRGLFKIPTGEQDADAEPQNGLPAKQAKDPDMQKKALAILREGAKDGNDGLDLAWKTLTVDMRNAAVASKEYRQIKELAAKNTPQEVS